MLSIIKKVNSVCLLLVFPPGAKTFILGVYIYNTKVPENRTVVSNLYEGLFWAKCGKFAHGIDNQTIMAFIMLFSHPIILGKPLFSCK